MILQWLKLTNIRSYVDQELHFPEGTILLNGDIGAGKTTILLAIEFALFGLLRGDTTGSTLLRHGAREGRISFCFTLNGKNIIVTRALKKSGNTIAQAPGSIIIDGQEQEATAIELKSMVLDLLGYPPSLLTKNTSLIYRYTVYTPQEAMKAILYEPEDQRLDTLRKIFGMDKYKRIQEQCSKYLKHLRDQQKQHFGQFQDLAEKEQQFKNQEQERETLQEQLATKKPLLEKVQEKIAERKQQLHMLEQEKEQYMKLQAQHIRYEEQLASIIHQRTQTKERVSLLQKQLQQQPGTLPATEEIEQTITTLQDDVHKLTQQQQQQSMSIGSFQAKIEAAKETMQQLQELQHCPLCLQDVTHDHKEKVHAEQQKNIETHQHSWEETKQQLLQLEKTITEKKKDIDQQRERLQKIAHLQAQHSMFLDKKKECEQLEEQLSLDQERIAHINKEKLRITGELFNAKKKQEEYTTLQKTYEDLLQEEKTLLVEVKGIEQTIMSKHEFTSTLQKEIITKKQAKQQYEEHKDVHQWLATHFIPLIETMEKHVMTKLYHDFNDRFQTWFSMLIEDETIQARLDASFTPVIIQNGYETTMDNLSGGEKTSCSLAYRLALTKVINDLLDTVQTKNLLILDEPTDGFSTQQIDKIGEVLDELNFPQVIIVSHEPKIESFVEHIITVHKEGHESTIA